MKRRNLGLILGDKTDSSSDSVYYSDHSYHESDDDGLYEAFV